jgi:hypothetical protein
MATGLGRIAAWIISTGYLALVVAVTVFAYLVQSQRMDIGGTMASVLLLGATGVIIAIMLLSGSVIGTTVLVRDSESRRPLTIVTIVAGWVGAIVLSWILWGFWTH